MKVALYVLAALLAVPFLVGLALGLAVPLALGPVRRRLLAHVEAIRSLGTQHQPDEAGRGAPLGADPSRTAPSDLAGPVVSPGHVIEAQAALRDAKRRYGFPPDAGGES